jgi:uncharacterized protein
MRGLARRGVIFAFGPAALVAACTSPNPKLYTLAPVPGAPQTGGPSFVVLHQVSIARYLERPEIVRSSENYRLDVLANQQWGEPLAQMIGRVLSDDLSQRLPGTTVFAVNGAITGREDASVEVNIQRMDLDSFGALAFSAQAAVTFTDPRMTPATRSIRTSIPVAAAETANEVQAMSIGIGQLADAITEMLRTPTPATKRRA